MYIPHKLRYRLLFLQWLLLSFLLALFTSQAYAYGAIGFLDPEHTTIVAGDPFSDIEIGLDWGNDGMEDHPTTLVSGDEYAVPNLGQGVNIESWRTSTHLHFIFQIEDSTRFIHEASGDNTLLIGDQIIIQIDPDHSDGISLSFGTDANPFAQDHRFKIVLKDQAINATFHAVPDSDGFWGENNSMADLATLCSMSVPAGYCVEVSIPLATLGNPSNDIGIAIAIVNDLGHHHDDGGFRIVDVTGTAFPSTMGFAMPSEPGLIEASVAEGNWLTPSAWGTGYFNVAPGDVTFSHSPRYWWSDSIRLGLCNATSWEDIQEPVTVGMDQLVLSNWYNYNPDNPCKMSIFFRAFKSGPGVVRKRLFVVWGRPGIAPQDWYPVQVTQPIDFSNSEETLSIIWDSVPAINFTAHPCLRVYLLPENLTGEFSEEGLLSIDTAAKLTAMEDHYSTPSGSLGTAQMNFNAISTGECTSELCQVVIGELDGARNERLQLASSSPLTQASKKVSTINGKGKKTNLVRIKAMGIGIETSNDSRRYTIISPIGGMGWALDKDRLNTEQRLEFNISLANPPIAAWNLGMQPPTKIASSPRHLIVYVNSEVGSGIAQPNVIVNQPQGIIQPGGEVEVSIDVTPGVVVDEPEPQKLNYWLWILVFLVIFILSWFFFSRRS